MVKQNEWAVARMARTEGEAGLRRSGCKSAEQRGVSQKMVGCGAKAAESGGNLTKVAVLRRHRWNPAQAR